MAALNIVIAGTGFGFPDGSGATARVMSFARGLRHHGATVHVLLPKPSENRTSGDKNPCLTGVFEGIAFEYTCGRRLAADTRVGAFLLYLRGIWGACLALRRIHRKTPIDAILFWYPEDVISFFAFRIVASLFGAAVIAEKCEFPFVYDRRSLAVRVRMWFNDHVTYKLLDGAIVISLFLDDYFSSRLRKTAKTLYVPILVDTWLFGQAASEPRSSRGTILYCGNLYNKGEVDTLLQAFAQVAGDFPSWDVQIIGDTSDSRRRTEIEALMAALGLMDRVRLLGQRTRREIPQLLAQGDIMALPRAAGTFSQAGFPTKLGEYLASGRPVVITAIGEVPRYLQDGKNAYLTPPGDTAAFAQALRRAMTHPDEAAEIGRRGRETAIEHFDTITNCGKIIEFIKALKAAGS